MFKSYLAHLQLRVEGISKLIGNTSDFKEADIKEVREGINDITVKLHKDNFRKFERIKKSLEKYSNVIDTLPSQEKYTFVNAFMEELHQIAAQLNRIEQLLPALNSDSYLKYRNQYKNVWLLNTCSKVQEDIGQKILAPVVEDEPLVNLRSQHRKSINELAELNAQIVNNLSIKLQGLKNKRLKQSGVS